MDIEEALQWVDRNCTDAATLDRLRSRRVAATLAKEVERLRLERDQAMAAWQELAAHCDRLPFEYRAMQK